MRSIRFVLKSKNQTGEFDRLDRGSQGAIVTVKARPICDEFQQEQQPFVIFNV